MRKLSVIFGVLILMMSSVHGQDYKLEEKSISAVYEVNEKSKSDLYIAINKWISINYNSAKNVIQMNDKESGSIIIKGINEIVYKNTWKSMYPSNSLINEYSSLQFNHLIQIDIKDNKYRIVFKITDIASNDEGFNDILLKGINFEGTNEQAIAEYNMKTDNLLKQGLIGKTRRENYLALTKPMFDEINTKLILDIKTILKSLESSIISSSKNDW